MNQEITTQQLLFVRVRGVDVESPRKAHQSDAGIDFFVERSMQLLYSRLQSMNPHLTDLIRIHKKYPGTVIEFDPIIANLEIIVTFPLGLRVSIEKNYMLCPFNKSGHLKNNKWINHSSVIDSGYDGEIHTFISFLPNHDQPITFSGDEKLVQMCLLPVPNVKILEVSNNTLTSLNKARSNRDTGGFGSTG